MKSQLHKWASVIAKAEGKKHQASVGDIREILKIMVGIIADEEFHLKLFNCSTDTALIGFIAYQANQLAIKKYKEKKMSARKAKLLRRKLNYHPTMKRTYDYDGEFLQLKPTDTRAIYQKAKK